VKASTGSSRPLVLFFGPGHDFGQVAEAEDGVEHPNSPWLTYSEDECRSR
jgi:hypothetical protein